MKELGSMISFLVCLGLLMFVFDFGGCQNNVKEFYRNARSGEAYKQFDDWAGVKTATTS